MKDSENQPRPERVKDAPQRLRELTDVAKGEAIAIGVAHAVGAAFEAEVESVRYGAFDRLQEFRRPAEIRLTVSAVHGGECSGVQRVPESALESAIARSLGEAAGEEYRVRIVDKQYGGAMVAKGAMRITLQVGMA